MIGAQRRFEFGPLARRADPLSSHEAADRIEPDLPRQHSEVLAAVRKHPGRTTKELAALSGLDRHMIGRRIPELVERGRVVRVAGAGGLRCFAR